MTTIYFADCYQVERHYNPRIRATVPQYFNLVMRDLVLEFGFLKGEPVEFRGDTVQDVQAQAIDYLKGMGLSGRLRVITE
jgi:hypothetical protein